MNRLVKVTPKMIGLWASILSKVPASRMVVLTGIGADQESRIRERFEQLGIDSARLRLVGWQPRRQYLGLFNDADLALDTFPYAGMTTTCDALWMGVPTVTLAGVTHVSRTGVSILSAAGLPELIAQTPEQYVSIATCLANDLQRLAALRSGLRARVEDSPLNDDSGLARAIESAFRDIWAARCFKTIQGH